MNHWLREHNRKKNQLQAGDLIYWKSELFNTIEWGSLIIQNGSGPMTIQNIYMDTKLGGLRLEVQDSNGNLIMGVDPHRVKKVGIDFKAEP